MGWIYFLLILLAAIIAAFLIIRWFIKKSLEAYMSKPRTNKSSINFPEDVVYKSDIVCFKCREEIDPSWLYCPMCGTKVIK